ncbi:hypothetical protein LOAG_15730 [Loa loa]|uniref:Uncharacterized protein n=1 Tax=Loa loa TaxID=7209 RepID=A0A1S0TF48_LOALO|nr:hypothetical protein LOAG_15730 [Loa loa]EFO12802.1 hypothetical protein LOAG_15730 [Loa loa]
MLRDFPELERQVQPIAIEFWTDYRRENTPEVAGDEYTLIGGDEQNVRLVHYYKDSYDHLHNPSRSVKTTPSTTTLFQPKKMISDSDEEDDDDDEDEDSDASVERKLLKGNLVTSSTKTSPPLMIDDDDDDDDDE